MSSNNILEIDSKIRKIYSKEIERLSDYHSKLNTIKYLLTDVLNLSHRVRNYLEKIKKDIENEITFLSFTKFYFIESRDVLQRYLQVMKTPTINSFFRKNNEQDENYVIKRKLYEEYKEILQPYQKLVQMYSTEPNLLCSLIKCDFCQSEFGFYLDENSSVCRNCLTEKIRLISISTFSDNNRINISNKYSYDRKLHFRDCINQYQGKQNTIIPEFIIENIKTALKTFGIGKLIKLSHVYMAMKHLGYTKYYDDAILILFKITGKQPKNIEHLEERLMQDFDLILTEYTNSFKYVDKKNFNTQYVLFQLLKKHNHVCDTEQLAVLKTNERKLFSDTVCKTIFEKFGWNYSSL